MANWKQENTVITDIGYTMLSKAQSGIGKLEITKIVSRDIVSTPEQNKLLTGDSSSIPYKQEAVLLSAVGGILDSQTSNADASQITARFSNEDIIDSSVYPIRQIVVFMRLTDLTDSNEDMGEVPYMVAQSENENDFDYMPSFSDNPTAISYDLFILHSGVAQINISIKTAGYVDEDKFSIFKNYVNNVVENLVGENTNEKTFNAWTPVYSDDRTWSKSGETQKVTGVKSAERFNCYKENENIATGEYSSVEGKDNVGLATTCHIEGESNHSGSDLTHGVHIEGQQNYATLGEFQHIEGACNQSSGYATHIEGAKNKVISKDMDSNSVEINHIEGQFNTINSGKLNHIEGTQNTAIGGSLNHIEGKSNHSENSVHTHINGFSNTVTNSGESQISGKENSIGNSNQITVSGYQNSVIQSEKLAVQGDNNTVSESKGSSILGQNNTITNSNDTILSGKRNTVLETHQSFISGDSNHVEKSLHSNISGISNSLLKDEAVETSFGVQDANVCGKNNTVSQTENSYITGIENSISDFKPNNITGERISSRNVVVAGEENALKGFFSSVVTGKSNNVTNIHDSFIGGRENSISSEVPDNETNCIICGGYRGVVTNKGKPMFITGTSNEISADNASVMGSNNIASGLDQTVIGHYNIADTKNEFAFIIGGGEKNGDNVSRENIFTVDWDGNCHVPTLFVENIFKEDGSQLNSWNIANGTGKGSLVGNNITANKSTAYYSSAFGNNTEATGLYSFTAGNANKSIGTSSASIGDSCESIAEYSFTSGFNCKAKSRASQVFGDENNADSNSHATFVTGYKNNAESCFASITTGQENTNKAETSVMTGKFNVNNSSSNSYIGGHNNTVTHSENSLILGSNSNINQSESTVNVSANSTISNSDYTFILGSNKNKVENAHNNLIIGDNIDVIGKFGTKATNNTVIGDYHDVYSSNSIVAGESNKVCGSRNIVVGYLNKVGFDNAEYIQKDHAISCNVTGTSNSCAGLFNTISGESLCDFSPKEYETNGNESLSDSNTPDTIAKNSAFFGMYNEMSSSIIDRNIFTIGGGSAPTKLERRNIFSVSKTGDVYTTGQYNTENADIAEWFEWKDKNSSCEDRRGLFVTLDGDKIVLADENTKYIQGVISSAPALVGNSYEDYWSDKYLKDVFGEILYEEYTDDKGLIKRKPRINPEFDPTKKYVPRSARPEWSYVSCVGRLIVVDDGTCQPNGYCKPKNCGIATNSTTGFRVMKRIDPTHILVWVKGAIEFE